MVIWLPLDFICQVPVAFSMLAVFSVFTGLNLPETWHTEPLCLGPLCEVALIVEDEDEVISKDLVFAPVK